FPVDPRIQDTVEEAVRAFTELGAVVEPVDFKLEYSHDELTEMWCNLLGISTYDILEEFAASGNDLRALTPQDLSPVLLKYADNVPNRTMSEWLDAQKMRTHVLNRFVDVFADYDLVASPTLAAMPVKNEVSGETYAPTEINGVTINSPIGCCTTYRTHSTHDPRASVAAGLVEGLRGGLRVTGRKAPDEDIMAAISSFEKPRPRAKHYEAVCNLEQN